MTLVPVIIRQRSAATIRCAVLLFFLSNLLSPCFGQHFWVEENEIEARLVDDISRCVVYLNDDTHDKYITGTLILSSGPVIVTNYHLLISSTDTVRVYLNTRNNTAEAFPCTFLKGDRENDLAAFRVQVSGKTRAQLTDGGFWNERESHFQLPSTNNCLLPVHFARPADIRRGCRIAFLGFPLNYGISVEPVTGNLVKKPIFRSGVIASEVSGNEFLIDAMVSNGNSASPVFVRTGATRRSNNSAKKAVEGDGFEPAYRLIGIMKEFQHDSIKIHGGDGSIQAIPHNAGIGVVIPVNVIKEFLSDLPAQP